MKNLIKTTLVVAVMLGTCTSYANDTLETAPKVISNASTFNNVKRGHQVSIKDISGATIYTEVVEINGDFNPSYDLTSLKDGLYTIELSKDFEIKIKAFVVASKTVTFLEKAEKTVFKPVFRTADNKVLISQLAINQEKPLEVKIYFENELIHSETISDEVIINRVYNLQKDVTGSYKVILKANDRVYKEFFEL